MNISIDFKFHSITFISLEKLPQLYRAANTSPKTMTMVSGLSTPNQALTFRCQFFLVQGLALKCMGSFIGLRSFLRSLQSIFSKNYLQRNILQAILTFAPTLRRPTQGTS